MVVTSKFSFSIKAFHRSLWFEFSLLKSLPNDIILDLPYFKDFADDIFKFDENGRKLSKRAENNVVKGEIARNEQFLLFPQCFQKACFSGTSKGVIVWEWVTSLPNDTILDQSCLKDFADDKINVTYVMNFFRERVENFGFFFFPAMFSKGLFVRVVKSRDCVVKSTKDRCKNSIDKSVSILLTCPRLIFM